MRLLCFLLPALGFLAFDSAVPSLAKGLKARGEKQLPIQLGRKKLLEIVGVAVFNILLSIAVQAGLELLTTQVLHLRSNLKITATVPLPWTILKDVAKGFVLRGCLRYAIHRYVLHAFKTPLRTWHLSWQHSIRLPFSLVAAYDHPVVYLLSQWLPVFLPAFVFRFHVLTWHVLLAVTSLEDLFVYSGYAVLPSSIVLAGMARRTDSHFAMVKGGKPVGNYGQLGILDFVFGTTCNDEVDVMDDLQSEAEKHRFQERIENSVQGAMSGLKGDQQSDSSPKDAEDSADEHEDDAAADKKEEAADAEIGADENADGNPAPQGQRKSSRRKPRRA